jgi:murein DD-endopeptidase MepM/ murein hydrolase activator NlpD
MRKLPLFLLALLPLPAVAVEVRFHPGDVVYTYEVDPGRGLSTVVLQNVAVVQNDAETVTLESLEIQAASKGQVTQTLIIPQADLDKSAKRMSAMEAQGALKLMDFYFQTTRYLNGIRLSPDRTLKTGTALVVFGKPLLLAGKPEQIVVVARSRDAAGKPVEARGSLRVEEHRSPNEYHFPVAGTWYVGAAPSLHSHHRWATNQEFALDLVALGGDGHTYKGQGSRLDDYYGYGKDVLAVADGVVVETAADATEGNEGLRQPGESTEDYDKRSGMVQNELLAKGPKALTGNFVIVRHEGNEYSNYIHMKQGSVKVKAGDTVKRGQVIGQLGHTGNSTEPHLHFQLTDGPDPMYSRGLPIVFSNTSIEGMGLEGRPIQSGWIVNTKD